MKQLRLFKTMLLMCLLLSGISNAWGETKTYQHVFTTKPSTGNGVSLSGVNWNIEATNLGSYNSVNYAGVQIGTKDKDGSITLTSTSNWSYQSKTKVTEVRLWLNLGGTSVTPSVSIGGKAAVSDGTTVVKNTSAGSDYTKTTKVTFTPASDGNTGVVVINVETVKAGYICAMEIDCDDTSSSHNIIVNKSYVGGSITSSASSAEPGTSITVNAYPESGYEFTQLSIKNDGGQSIFNDVNVAYITDSNGKYTGATFTMPNQNVTLYGVFELLEDVVPAPVFDVLEGSYKDSKTIHVSNYDDNYMYFYTSDGSIPDCDDALDAIGTSQFYENDKGITISKTTTLKMIAVDEYLNKSEITSAAYKILGQYALNITTPENGEIVAIGADGSSINSGDNVYEDDVITLTAIPDTGYEFISWSVSGAAVADAKSATTPFTMPAANVNVSAKFNEVHAFEGTVTKLSAENDADIKFITGSSSATGAIWANSTPLSANNITLGGSVTSGTNYSYYDGSVVRFYANNEIVISPSSETTIEKIEIVRQTTTSSNSGTINCSGLTASSENTTTNTNVFTGSATSAVTFTNTAQCRFTKILVYTTNGKALQSIAVSCSPTKTIYEEGETFDPAGLVISKKYDDDSTEDVVYSEENRNKFTFTPDLETGLTSSDKSVEVSYAGKTATIYITVNEKRTYTIQFSVNGNIDDTQNFLGTSGVPIHFPVVQNVDDYTCIGWVKNAIETPINTSPEYFTSADVEDSDVTYYALYALKDFTGEQSWDKITHLNDITDGTYVIINGGYYLPNTKTDSDKSPSAVAAPAISDNKISGTVEDVMKWRFIYTGTANQFFIKNGEKYLEKDIYLYETNINNGIRISTTEDSWTFENNQNGEFAMKGKNNGRYCAKYDSGSDWRSYSSATASNYANGGKVELYKENAIYTYNNYCTIVIPRELLSIAVSGAPTITEYYDGDVFNPEGLSVEGTYSDGSTKNISSGIEWAVTPSALSVGTTSVSVVATANNISSNPYTVNGLTVSPILTSLQEIYDKSQLIGTEPKDVKVQFGNWVVSGVNGNQVYLTDGQKGAFIYTRGHGFLVGDVLSGTLSTKLQNYEGAAEFSSLTAVTPGLIVNKGGSVEPITVMTSDLDGSYTGVVLEYKDMVYDEKSGSLSDETNTIKPHNTLYDKDEVRSFSDLFVDGEKHDVTGVYTLYNGSVNEILPRNSEDIILKGYTITIIAPEHGTLTVTKNGQPVASGDTATKHEVLIIDASTEDENYKFENIIVTDHEPHLFGSHKEWTMLSSPITITAKFVPKEMYTVNWSVNGEIIRTDVDVLEGNTFTPPSVTVPDYTDKVFTGWVTTPSVDYNTTPSYVDFSTAKVTNDITYYAVFAKKEGNGENSYMKATNLEIGDKVVFALGEVGGKPEQAVTGANSGATISSSESEWIVYTAVEYPGKGIVLQLPDGRYQRTAKGNFDFTADNPSTMSTNANSHVIGYGRFVLFSTPANGNKFYEVKGEGYVEFNMWKLINYVSFSEFTTRLLLELSEAKEEITTDMEMRGHCDKVIINRSIKKDTWSTLCLPFAMNESQIVETFGEKADVRALTGLEVNGNSYTMKFSPVTSIAEGTPYMIRLEEPVNSILVKDVDVYYFDDDYCVDAWSEDNNNCVEYHGSYIKQTIEQSPNNYIISGNKFYFVNSDVTNKGFRGWFEILSDGNSAASLSASFDDETDGIISINSNVSGNDRYYNIAGQRVSNAHKGVFIKNGKKYVVK